MGRLYNKGFFANFNPQGADVIHSNAESWPVSPM
jgi:hypothetical protein